MTDPVREEQEILADEKAAIEMDEEAGAEGELAPDPEDEKVEYIEFLGTEPSTYGTEFYAPGVVGHTITRKHMKDNHAVSMTKDLEWTKAAAGKHKGRMLVPVEGLNQETLDILENDPMFKRVSL